MILETELGFDLDLTKLRLTPPLWNEVSVRNAIASWMMRTLSRDLLGVRVTVWKNDQKSRYTYTFHVDFRERGGGVEWNVYTRYVVDVPVGLGRYKSFKVHTLADATEIEGPEIERVFFSIREDISHLLTFYGACSAVREEK
tara:strand:+ start:654 stop:1079 length:426 start_codon:yes stop_codon:yes gene_type:complete